MERRLHLISMNNVWSAQNGGIEYSKTRHSTWRRRAIGFRGDAMMRCDFTLPSPPSHTFSMQRSADRIPVPHWGVFGSLS